MIPATLNLTIYRDRDFSKTLYFKTSLGEIMDLTGYTGKAEIRENKDAAALTVAFQVTIAPLLGSVVLSLADTQTMLLPDGISVWDLVLTDPHGSRQNFIEGVITVLGTVTRDTDVGGMEMA
jgi:hypothetical protein